MSTKYLGMEVTRGLFCLASTLLELESLRDSGLVASNIIVDRAGMREIVAIGESAGYAPPTDDEIRMAVRILNEAAPAARQPEGGEA